MQEPQMGEV